MIPRNLDQAPGMSSGSEGARRMAGFLRLGALLGGLALAACAGPPTPQAPQLAEVKPLQTTYDQVVAVFGLPSSELYLTGGGKVALYDLPDYERNFHQMTPFVNLFENNYDLVAHDYFIFDKNGVLQSFSIPHFARAAEIPDPGV
jgi:hypothetical protein